MTGALQGLLSRTSPLLSLLALAFWPRTGTTEEDDTAREIEPLDEEFLEYLADFEGSEEDWTLFTSDAPEAQLVPAARREEESP